jgi:hypothetical protein
VVGLLNSALEHDSSSLLDFLFRDPLGETAVVVVIVIVIVGPLNCFFYSFLQFFCAPKAKAVSGTA